MISGEIIGIEPLTAKLLKAGPTFLKRMRQGMTNATSGLRNYIAYQKISGQVLQVRTSHLRNFLFWKVTTDGDEVLGQVYETMKYGKVHEYGMTITAIRSKYLRFIGKDGKPKFRKSVTIPARPWMRPGYDENKPEIMKALRGSAEQAASDMSDKGAA